MIRKTVSCILAIHLISGALLAQNSAKTYAFEVDFAKEAKSNPIKWKNTGFTPGARLLDKDMQLSLDYLAAVPGGDYSYIRPHWMLRLVDCRGMDTESPEFNFERLDAALDEMLTRGFKPILEIMGFPALHGSSGEGASGNAKKHKVRRWNPDFEKEEDYRKWYDFIYALISHLEKRYGEAELKTWFFECTNEPDMSPHFWDRGIPALLNYWDATSEAIKAVNEAYQFGGPGVAYGLSEEFKAVLAHCDNGVNAITGERGAVLDFISVHKKELPYEMIQVEKRVVKYIRKKHPRFADLPFWNDEADPTWGWSQRYWWRAHPWYAAFVVQSLDAHNRLMVDSLGVNYGMLINDHGFMGDWYQRTLTARFKNPEQDDQFWLFKKPVFSVMTMLALGEGERYGVRASPAESENLSVIPSKTENGEVVVILANKPDFGSVHDGRKENERMPAHQKRKHDAQGAGIELSLKNIGIKNPEVMQVQLDASHGNAHGAWESLGRPDTITPQMYREIASKMDPVVVSEGVDFGGEALDLFLPPSSVTMVLIRDKQMKTGFSPPEIKKIREYQGYGGERMNFVRWHPTAGATVRYNVYASYDRRAYKQINPAPVFDTGYLDVVPDHVQSARYRIEAIW